MVTVNMPAAMSISMVDALAKTFIVPADFGCSPTNGIFYSPRFGLVPGKSELAGQPRSATL